MDEVLECFTVAGESDYVLHIVAPDLQSLSKDVLQRLTQIRGVSSVRSSVVLETVKATTSLQQQDLIWINGHWTMPTLDQIGTPVRGHCAIRKVQP